MATTLSAAASTTLAVVGGVVTGRVELGPSSQSGPPVWMVDGVILLSSRPGAGPVPRAQVFRNESVPPNAVGLSYDGSFAQGTANERLTRGERLIVVWTGGLAGDVVTCTLTGKKE